jgi:hypothetical protein
MNSGAKRSSKHPVNTVTAITCGSLSDPTNAPNGVRRNDWITLPPRTIDAFARGFRWWHRATSKLEKVGLIDCQRHTGKLPRYRLKKAGPGAPQKAHRTIPIKSANERKQGPI